MKKIDKIRAIDLLVFGQDSAKPEMFFAHIRYDVSKLRRVSDEKLTAILFEKTLKLYPFAVINKEAKRFKSKRTAVMELWLPLSSKLRITKVIEGDGVE